MKKSKIKLGIGILIVSVFVALSARIILKAKDTHMYSDSDLYPDSKTLTVGLSDVKQTPWSTVDTYTFELESFGSAVFGSLTEINESGVLVWPRIS
jgi:hypothetical protein